MHVDAQRVEAAAAVVVEVGLKNSFLEELLSRYEEPKEHDLWCIVREQYFCESISGHVAKSMIMNFGLGLD